MSGQPVANQRGDLLELARQVVPANVEKAKPPAIKPGVKLGWPDVHRFLEALDDSFADESTSLLRRLVATLNWVSLVAQTPFTGIEGSHVDDLLKIFREAARRSIDEELELLREPSAVGRTQFRLLAGHYARKDTYGSKDNTLAGRLRLLRSALRLTAGTGNLPVIQSAFRELPFEQLEQPFGIPDGVEALFTRYFRVKIQGLSFCGAAYYGVRWSRAFRAWRWCIRRCSGLPAGWRPGMGEQAWNWKTSRTPSRSRTTITAIRQRSGRGDSGNACGPSPI